MPRLVVIPPDFITIGEGHKLSRIVEYSAEGHVLRDGPGSRVAGTLNARILMLWNRTGKDFARVEQSQSLCQVTPRTT